jgi:hypothetical protein
VKGSITLFISDPVQIRNPSLESSPFPLLPMQVTITLLPVSLSLVHIPRSRLTRLTHPVLRQILQPNPAFLNITCNEIELSIFTEHDMLHDFEVISRRDRHRRRKYRLESISNQNPSPVREHVEISDEKWNVLQIDSHNDQIGMYSLAHYFPIFLFLLLCF